MNDKLGIYKIALDIGIKINIEDEELLEIEKRIENIKNMINFIESKISFKWYNSNNSERDKIILNFIRSKLLEK